MAYIGKTPTPVPLTSSDITDGIVSIADLATTGTASSSTFLRGDGAFAEAGGGKVLQVVQTYITSVFSTSSGSFVDVTNLTAAITPSATSSKVLVILNSVIGNDSSSTNRVALLRGSTNIGYNSGGSSHGFYEHNLSPQGNGHASLAYHFLDSPSTTSATTYKIQCHSEVGDLVIGGRANGGNPCASTLTLIEIGA